MTVDTPIDIDGRWNDLTVDTHMRLQPTPIGPGNAIAELIRSRSAAHGHAAYLTEARGSRQVSFRALEH